MRTKAENRRTVAQLLTLSPHGLKAALQKVKSGNHPTHLYVYCRSTAIAKRFLADAEREGFTFGDGKLPTSKDTSNLFALNDDYTINYTGIAAHMMFGSRMENVCWVDYEKYVSGERDFRVRKKRIDCAFAPKWGQSCVCHRSGGRRYYSFLLFFKVTDGNRTHVSGFTARYPCH